jgi:hypothetical protein
MSNVDQTSSAAEPSQPSPARMYDYYLGGTANYQADRDAVHRILELVPEIKDAAWANRGFLQRAVRWMTLRGIRQFIDMGAGMPTQRPTHEVARAIAPDARVLYCDIDPGVIVHGKAILAGVPDVAIVQADLRQPEQLFGVAATRDLIDFHEPVGLLMVAVTQFIADADDPWGTIARYLAELAPGSYLALSAPTADHMTDHKVGRILDVYAASTIPTATARTAAAIEQFFAGLEIVPPYRGAKPALTSVGLWDCEDPDVAESDGSRSFYAAVARKPGVATGFKPTVEDLGLDVTELTWRRSSSGPGAIEVAFADAGGQGWVLMRLSDDPSQRVSVFDSFEWECFIDGAKRGEFDEGVPGFGQTGGSSS